MLTLVSFAISVLSLIVSILDFALGYKEKPRTRRTVGLVFLAFAIAFGVLGAHSFVQSQQETVPFLGQPSPSVESLQPYTPSVRMVDWDETKKGIRKTYSVFLGDDEVIVGDAYRFQNEDQECIIFLIEGPGQKEFTIFDGVWYKYSNVTTQAQIEELLQERMDYYRTLSFCKDVFQIRRLK